MHHICSSGSKTVTHTLPNSVICHMPLCIAGRLSIVFQDILGTQITCATRIIGWSVLAMRLLWTKERWLFTRGFFRKAQVSGGGDGMLMVLLASGPFEIECVQAMGSELYRSQAGAMMVVVPNSDFWNLAFKLAAAEVPWPENFEDRE